MKTEDLARIEPKAEARTKDGNFVLKDNLGPRTISLAISELEASVSRR